MTLFLIVLACYAVYSTSGGVCTIPFMDIVAKTVPRRRMHMLFSYRQLFGGVVGFLAGVVVVKLLSVTTEPRQYAFLILLGTFVSVLAYLAFMNVREPVEPVPARRVPFMDFLKRGPVIFRRDSDYRRLFLYRCFWSFAAMSQAVFVFVRRRISRHPLLPDRLVCGSGGAGRGVVQHRLGQGVPAVWRGGFVAVICRGPVAEPIDGTRPGCAASMGGNACLHPGPLFPRLSGNVRIAPRSPITDTPSPAVSTCCRCRPLTAALPMSGS